MHFGIENSRTKIRSSRPRLFSINNGITIVCFFLILLTYEENEKKTRKEKRRQKYVKIAIAMKEDLDKGLTANAAACIISGLFHNGQDLLGEEIIGKDCTFIPITKIPLLILRQNKKSWEELLLRAKRAKLKYMVFTKEGQSTTNYEEYIQRVKGKSLAELTVIGLGVLGDDKQVSSFCGDLPLMR